MATKPILTKASAAFTPGPWEYLDIGEICAGDDFNVTIALMNDGTSSAGVYEVEANARLIAAAPDLLSALEKLRTQALQSPDLLNTKWGQEALNYSHAAIAKARGAA